MSQGVRDYGYTTSAPVHAHAYLLPIVDRVRDEVRRSHIFDLGCGMSRRCEVIGIETSESAIDIANKSFPALRVERGSDFDDLAGRYGTFSAVVSLEVVEHLYDPRKFARNIFDLLEPAGVAICYLKIVALAVSGKMDDHFMAL
jgi:2-polyprenyl-6-hydroxyphenyl methylase/3-demethylubiquinone-9 3-methyltransferase